MGMLAYAPGVIRGIPAWAMSIIIYSAVATAAILLIIRMYPDEFPAVENAENLMPELHTFSPHTSSMTKAELSQRSVYDASNDDVVRRRSTLSIQRRSAVNQISEMQSEDCNENED